MSGSFWHVVLDRPKISIKRSCSLRFFSHDHGSGLGFQLNYYSIQGIPQYTYRIGQCGGNFTTPNGIITSPSYPFIYPANADCVYTILQPNGTIIVLNFHDMDIDHRWPLCHESENNIEIRDGPFHRSMVLSTLCGNKIPAPLQSSQNKLWMR